MTYAAALALTVAVEVPLYVGGLVALRLSGALRAFVVAVGVNLLTHPLLWLTLVDGASSVRVLAAEACVCIIEGAVLRAVVGRDGALTLLLATGANAASFAVGLAVSAACG